MDGIVVVFEVTVYDSETMCPVMFCQHDSYEAATDYVRRQLGKSRNSRYGTALIKCGIIVSIIVRSWPSHVEVESGAYYW